MREVERWADEFPPAVAALEAADYGMSLDEYELALRKLPALLSAVGGGEQVLAAAGLVRRKVDTTAHANVA